MFSLKAKEKSHTLKEKVLIVSKNLQRVTDFFNTVSLGSKFQGTKAKVYFTNLKGGGYRINAVANGICAHGRMPKAEAGGAPSRVR